MAEKQQPSASPLKRIRPKTYSIAVYIVGLFIVLQIIALGSIFWFRQKVVKIETQAPSLHRELQNKPELANLPTPEATPRLPISEATTKEAQIRELNEKAREYRLQGDYSLARASLQRALDLDPEYPNTLVNLAMLEEAMENPVKALEYWQRVIILGDKASTSINLARERAGLLEERLRREQGTRNQEIAAVSAPKKVLLQQVITMPNPIPDKPNDVQFDFVIQQSNEVIDPSKMRIQVFLYDQLPNLDLMPARIEARFLNPQPRWSPNHAETLRVHYQLSMQDGSQNRKYYGYLFRLIYEDEVQDEKAEPASLLTLFPYQRPK
jgi:tetratricopeptide (TPR) repeat protein